MCWEGLLQGAPAMLALHSWASALEHGWREYSELHRPLIWNNVAFVLLSCIFLCICNWLGGCELLVLCQWNLPPLSHTQPRSHTDLSPLRSLCSVTHPAQVPQLSCPQTPLRELQQGRVRAPGRFGLGTLLHMENVQLWSSNRCWHLCAVFALQNGSGAKDQSLHLGYTVRALCTC